MADEMRAELNGVKERLQGVDGRLLSVEGRLDGVESRLAGVEGRLDGVERRLGTVEDRLGKTMVAVSRLTGEVSEIKETMATKDEMRRGFSRVTDRLDELMPWTEAVKRDRDMASHSYMEHQRQLEDHEKRIANLEAPKRPDVGS